MHLLLVAASSKTLALTWHAPIQQPKIELTNEQLKAYDGSDPSKPLYLALNRTIYDVSSSPHIYGPGGPYHKLAAKDASRSYVTTCFDPEQDLVPYLGGVEEVFVPLWLSKNPSQKELDSIAKGDVMEGMGMKGLLDQIQKQIGRKKTRLMREAAYEEALDKVRAKIQTWEGMFAKKEYPVVGRVVGVDDADESKWKDLKLCDDALAQRPPLAESMSQVMKAAGSKDGKIDLGMMKKKKKQPGYPGFDASDVRRSEDKRKQEMAKAKRDDMKEDGKYGSRGSKKEEDAARSEERQRRREERKAEIAARKGIKPEDVSDQIADALKDTVVDE